MSGQDERDADSCLTSQCEAFCQTLARQGKEIKFDLKIGNHVSFFGHEGGNSSPSDQQKSPSAKRQIARRKKKFLASKEA